MECRAVGSWQKTLVVHFACYGPGAKDQAHQLIYKTLTRTQARCGRSMSAEGRLRNPLECMAKETRTPFISISARRTSPPVPMRPRRGEPHATLVNTNLNGADPRTFARSKTYCLSHYSGDELAARLNIRYEDRSWLDHEAISFLRARPAMTVPAVGSVFWKNRSEHPAARPVRPRIVRYCYPSSRPRPA